MSIMGVKAIAAATVEREAEAFAIRPGVSHELAEEIAVFAQVAADAIRADAPAEGAR